MFRAGVIGGLPRLWILFDALTVAVERVTPLAFRALAVVMLITFTAIMLAASGVVGLIGPKVANWFAEKRPWQRLPNAGT